MSSYILGKITKLPIVVVIIWLIISLSGIILSTNLTSHLTTSLSVPGTQSEQAESILNTKFSEKSEGYISVIYKFGTLNNSEISALKGQISDAAAVVPHSRIVQQQAIAGNLFTVIASDASLTQSAQHIASLRSELAAKGLNKALVSGPPAIFHDVKPVLAQDLHRGQLIAALVAGALLIITLGFSWAVFVPLIFAFASVTLTLGILSILSDRILMVLYIPNIVELIGFGLAIDYSLLVLHRFRTEARLNPSTSDRELVFETVRTAGKTVVLSGLTVSVALSTLMLIPVPFLRSLGLAGALVPLTSVIASLTLLPALLLLLGRRGISAYKFTGFLSRTSDLAVISKVSTLILTKTKTVFFLSILTLIALATPLLALQITPSSLTTLPQKLESAQALTYISDKAGQGVITPIVLIADLRKSGRSSDSTISAARIATAQHIGSHPDVLIVAQGERAPYVEDSGRYIRLFIFAKENVGSAKTQQLVRDLRSTILPKSELATYADFYLGGAPAQGVDLLNSIRDAIPQILLLFTLLIFIILMRAFKSVLIPIKALLLDFISICAALGVLVAMMKFGVAKQLFGTYQLPQLEVWVLVFLIAILLGISMDYEVFIVSRMREAWLKGSTNSEAVISGFQETIGVVTSAALIFIGAVSGFILGSFAGLQELGIGLAAAILIDATIIRFLLLPSAMILLGDLNWWVPKDKSRTL